MTFLDIRLLPRGRFVSWLVVFLLGISAFSKQVLAKEWEFNVPIGEADVLCSEGQIQGPLIHVNEGDDVIVHVKNNTPFKRVIRWHGVYQMDDWRNDDAKEMTKRLLSIQKAIDAGKSFTYRWKAEKTGTFWYHCHVNIPKQAGMDRRYEQPESNHDG